MSLIEYRLQRHPEGLAYSAGMYEYIVAGNGTFVRGKRDGLDVQMMLGSADVRGLAPATEFFKFDFPKVSVDLVNEMLEAARQAQNERGETVEILFYLVWDSNPLYGEWHLITPDQHQSATACRPTNTMDPYYQKAVIEVHSHHGMRAFFSGQDDKDEVGFKIYAVLGEIFTKPTILVRCGLYGYFMFLAADQVFDLPEQLDDGAWPAMDFTEVEKEEISAQESLDKLEESLKWLATATTDDFEHWAVLELSTEAGEQTVQVVPVIGERWGDAYEAALSTATTKPGGLFTDALVKAVEDARPNWASRYLKAVR